MSFLDLRKVLPYTHYSILKVAFTAPKIRFTLYPCSRRDHYFILTKNNFVQTPNKYKKALSKPTKKIYENHDVQKISIRNKGKVFE